MVVSEVTKIILAWFPLADGEPVIGFIIPVQGSPNEFAIGIGRRVGIISWDGKSPKARLVRIALEVEKSERYKTNRFNDAKADPTGRFYGGTMRLEECGDIFDAAEGSFYRYAKDEELAVLRTNIGVSNGLTWNTEKKKFYYIDTCTSDVKEFDYDATTGNICRFRLNVVQRWKLRNVYLCRKPTLLNFRHCRRKWLTEFF